MKILSGNQLKILALLAMTCDHVAVQLFPQYEILRIIGRLALPIYGYMIAEGCRYTKDRKRYLLSIFLVALLCQVVYFIAERSLYQCILVTFSLSVAWIYVIDHAKERKTVGGWLLAGVVSLCIYFVSVIVPVLLKGQTDFNIDYGFWGILLPVAIYYCPKKYKVLAAGAVLTLLSLERGGIQWWSLAALGLLVLYSGKRGKWNMKNLFYIYYPLHFGVIYLIDILI